MPSVRHSQTHSRRNLSSDGRKRRGHQEADECAAGGIGPLQVGGKFDSRRRYGGTLPSGVVHAAGRGTATDDALPRTRMARAAARRRTAPAAHRTLRWLRLTVHGAGAAAGSAPRSPLPLRPHGMGGVRPRVAPTPRPAARSGGPQCRLPPVQRAKPRRHD